MTSSTKIGLPWSEVAERWPDAVFFWDRDVAPEGWDPLMLERGSVFVPYDSVLFADDRACIHATPIDSELVKVGGATATEKTLKADSFLSALVGVCTAPRPANWFNESHHEVWSKCKCRVWVGDRWITRRASLTWRSEVILAHEALVQSFIAMGSTMLEFGGAVATAARMLAEMKLPINEIERSIVLDEMSSRRERHAMAGEARAFGGPAVFVNPPYGEVSTTTTYTVTAVDGESFKLSTDRPRSWDTGATAAELRADLQAITARELARISPPAAPSGPPVPSWAKVRGRQRQPRPGR